MELHEASGRPGLALLTHRDAAACVVTRWHPIVAIAVHHV